MNPAAHRLLLSNATKQTLEGWTLLELEQVDSTNLVAAALPAWHAVRANTQTAGRGRFQRHWVSDRGGLWLSAVVPVTERPSRELLPLAAGLAVIEVLNATGVRGARLRWPNDIMVGERKLAGLLVDRFTPGTAVVGIGVNVVNQPAETDAALHSIAVRLADLVSPVPDAVEVAVRLLGSLKRVVGQLQAGGLAELCPRINELWAEQRQVKLDLDGTEEVGWFCGVDEFGRLLLRDTHRQMKVFEPHQVRLLREMPANG